MSRTELYPQLQEKINRLAQASISPERKETLQALIDFIQEKKDKREDIRLNFICTHNSRRSQLGQVWARAISAYYGLETECFSGGTEETAFHQNGIDALERAGFRIEKAAGRNQEVNIYFSGLEKPLVCYSKLYNAETNPSENFAALMTCAHAEENCPFIPGTQARIPLDYKDPKEFDDTPYASVKYDERSDQIASEMIYVFKNIK